MRFRSVKALLLSGVLLITGVAAGAATKPAGSEIRYVFQQDAVQEYIPEFQGTLQEVLEGPKVGYVIDGEATASGYTLTIGVKGLRAVSGQLALQYDNKKLTLQGEGEDAFHMSTGVTLAPDAQVLDQTYTSQEDGSVFFAWASRPLEATAQTQVIATLDFTVAKDAEIDASTFRLYPMDTLETRSNDFPREASLQGKRAGEAATDLYLCMSPYPAIANCGVDFAYEGAKTVSADSQEVTFQCRNNLDRPLVGLLELNGQTLLVDGESTVRLAPGQYSWRIRSDGYGAWTDTLVVADAPQTIPLTFQNNASLVEAAEPTLDITYLPQDSAQRVTGNLVLPSLLDGEVAVSWQSSEPAVITPKGLVYTPEKNGVEVTLTATLSRGDASATKTFTVYVPSEAELNPSTPSVPAPTDTQGGTAAKKVFTDLEQYTWAKDAIDHLVAEGVIKGTSETTFTPASNVRRGDYILMLMRLLELDTQETAEPFADVLPGSYYYDAITKARALGIAEGIGDDRFAPEASITRQDMVTLTVRALEHTEYLQVTNVADSLNTFLDSSKVSSYAQESMLKAVGQKWIIGDQNLLNPLGFTTRAEAAVFVERILNAHNG